MLAGPKMTDTLPDSRVFYFDQEYGLDEKEVSFFVGDKVTSRPQNETGISCFSLTEFILRWFEEPLINK